VSFDASPWIMKLKGKDYLVVAGRLVWLNQDHPRFTITTSFLKLEESYAIAYAVVEIRDEAGAVVKSATGTKREDRKDFADFESKAETGAIGRALGMLGIGTQYAVQDFDELDTKSGEPRIVDTPQEPRPSSMAQVRRETALKATPAPAGEFAPYDHESLAESDYFSGPKVKRLFAIGSKLWPELKGEALAARIRQAASRIVKSEIAHLDKLHYRDGNDVMKQLEATAVEKGVWGEAK
jgi:hypothetical protein